MKPTTAFEWACYNAARLTRQIYGEMSLEEIAGHLSFRYDRPVAEILAAIRTYAAPVTDRRIDGYNPEFLGAKPAKVGEDY